MQNKILLSLLMVLSFPVFARLERLESFESLLCRFDLKGTSSEPRPVLPDKRSAQEIIQSVAQTTSDFHRTHSGFELRSMFGSPEGESQSVLLKQEDSLSLLGAIGGHLIFTKDIEQGAYFEIEDSTNEYLKTWVLQDERWLSSQKAIEYRPIRNVRLSSNLYPSQEFFTLNGRTKGSGSILQRQVEFMRFHPTVIARVPLDLPGREPVNVLSRLTDLILPYDEYLVHREQLATMKGLASPGRKEVASDDVLGNVIQKMKREVDAVVGAETNWTLSAAKTINGPFANQTELIVKIDHPNVETAWSASLEFVERYANLLKKKGVKEPDPDAITFTAAPVGKPK